MISLDIASDYVYLSVPGDYCLSTRQWLTAPKQGAVIYDSYYNEYSDQYTFVISFISQGLLNVIQARVNQQFAN